MTAAAAFRGQPLLVLAVLLGAWLALRVALWWPAADAALMAAANFAEAAPAHAQDGAARRAEATGLGVWPGVGTRSGDPRLSPMRPDASLAWIAPLRLPALLPPGRGEGVAEGSSAVRSALGHTLLLAAGLSQMDLPPALAAYFAPPAPTPGIPAAAPMLEALPQHALSPAGSRWSGDAWLMVRQDSAATLAPGHPSYGRSQAGAVVRYRLARSSRHAPLAYVRASSSLAGPAERELAAGLSARAVAGVPVRVALEARVTETSQGSEVRPAAFAVTELRPAQLPHGFTAEAYLQGGYVGGRSATAFVDGQARVGRTVARIGDAEVSAGAGAWGGAQDGAARLDVGPTAAVAFRLGPRSFGARGRVAADYRVRVAGRAEPRSGPALTLSAGF